LRQGRSHGHGSRESSYDFEVEEHGDEDFCGGWGFVE
jgi:hypothetical protein